MFENEYREKMDEIRADGYIKQKVLRSMRHKKGKTPSRIVITRAAAAVVTCFALVISVFALKSEQAVIPTAPVKQVSYGDIYQAVKKFQPSFMEETFDFLTDGWAKNSDLEEGEVVYEYVTDEVEVQATDDADVGSSVEYSETNVQVEGVAESDIVITDGKYIYSLSHNKQKLRIIKAGKSPELVSTVYFEKSDFYMLDEMYLVGKRIVVMGNSGKGKMGTTTALIYDVSSPEKPEMLYECTQSGYYNTSRVIGDKLYLITDYNIAVRDIAEKRPSSYIPTVYCEDFDGTVAASTVKISENCEYPRYTVICGFSVEGGSLLGTQSVLGGTQTVYCSTKNIITAGHNYNDETPITRYSIDAGKVELKAEGKIKGWLLNQFSIDEYKGNFRFVTTLSGGVETRNGNVVSYQIKQSNSLVILNSDLEQIGAIENLAPDERVYSVRFMGDIAYFVTFRQVDPLFSADLSDPNNPKIIGALKIPGFSNYLFPYGEGKLLGLGQDADEKSGATKGMKLSMFDISDPSNVTESAKTVIEQQYSNALYNHKASLVDYKRNLIGFSLWGNYGNEYHIYTFENGGFRQLAEIKLNAVNSDLRGLYINDEFYIVGEEYILVYSMTDYTEIAKLEL